MWHHVVQGESDVSPLLCHRVHVVMDGNDVQELDIRVHSEIERCDTSY